MLCNNGHTVNLGEFFCRACGADVTQITSGPPHAIPYLDMLWFCPGKTGARRVVPPPAATGDVDGAGFPVVQVKTGVSSPYPAVWPPYVFYNAGGGLLGIGLLQAFATGLSLPTGMVGDVIPAILPPYLLVFGAGGVQYLHLLNEASALRDWLAGGGKAPALAQVVGAGGITAGTVPAVHLGPTPFVTWVGNGGNTLWVLFNDAVTNGGPIGMPVDAGILLSSPCVDSEGRIWTTGGGNVYVFTPPDGVPAVIPVDGAGAGLSAPWATEGGCRFLQTLPGGVGANVVQIEPDGMPVTLGPPPNPLQPGPIPIVNVHQAVVRSPLGSWYVVT